MWILVITLLSYRDPVDNLPEGNVHSIEFSSKSNCESAKTTYLSGYSELLKSVRENIAAEREVGALKGETGFLMNAICLKK